MIGWDSNEVLCNILHSTNQVIHCCVEQHNSNKRFFCFFVYASNDDIERRQLWEDLILHKGVVKDAEWLIIGDFNVSLTPEDKSTGSSVVTSEMNDFRECVENIEVEDLNQSSFHFTWVQKMHDVGKDSGVLKKIDRAMCSNSFVDKYSRAHVEFQPHNVSDHTPMLLSIPNMARRKVKPFRFSNHLAYKPKFLPLIGSVWDQQVQGFKILSVVSKLKLVKKKLRQFSREKGSVFDKVKKLKIELERVQTDVMNDPDNLELREEENAYFKAYKEASIDEERLLIQKTKLQWLKEGDQNTAYFHKVMKTRLNRNRIEAIEDVNGILFKGNEVPDQFVKFYSELLGKKYNVSDF
ncbi:uncharacterized protein [Rutidosis leptorrhynchoides]|uniref:uncharacterized protein n=1 Tax=Rutidosis leptorrhynchoides TaxID=125765 RepID=UPI003A9A5E80